LVNHRTGLERGAKVLDLALAVVEFSCGLALRGIGAVMARLRVVRAEAGNSRPLK
jgi:hypothetical protein